MNENIHRYVLELIALQEPWDGGYGGFNTVSAEDFEKPRPSRTQKQLGYEPTRDALTVVSGSHEVYDDNGFSDSGWVVSSHVRRLLIPSLDLVDLINKEASGEVTVPAEYLREEGQFTFDTSPSESQLKEIADMKEPSGAPHHYGSSDWYFSYGLLRLKLTPQGDRTGIIIGRYLQNTETGSSREGAKRDLTFFKR